MNDFILKVYTDPVTCGANFEHFTIEQKSEGCYTFSYYNDLHGSLMFSEEIHNNDIISISEQIYSESINNYPTDISCIKYLLHSLLPILLDMLIDGDYLTEETALKYRKAMDKHAPKKNKA